MKKHGLLVVLFILTLAAAHPVRADEGDDGSPRLRYFFSERTRFTGFNHAITLDETGEPWSFPRHRTALGFVWSIAADLDFTLAARNEFRVWLSPGDREFTLNEVFFDQLSLRWRNVAGWPLTLTLGRQNIMLGEGFVCMDAQPLTGSRSAYFNAIRGDWRLAENHALTAFVSTIPTYDDHLPVFHENDPPSPLTEQADVGMGLYYTGKFRHSEWQLYVMRKRTEANDTYPLESAINTLGTRLRIPLLGRLEATVEVALQNGTTGEWKRRALGGYLYFTQRLGEGLAPLENLKAGVLFLGGDDPATERIEGWDPLWSRWPKWSESYIYTLIPENDGRVAYWSNLNSVYGTLTARLTKSIHCEASFYHLTAPQDNLSAFCGGPGHTRGNLITLWARYRIDKHWTGHFLWENFSPGDFYFDGARGYDWFRFELTLNL